MNRVGIVTSSFPSTPGDPAGAFVEEHARWLGRRGAEVEVLAARPGATDFGDGISVTRLGGGRAGGSLFAGEGAPERLERGKGWAAALAISTAMAVNLRRRARNWDCAIAHWLVPSGVAAATNGLGLPLTVIAHSGDVHLLRRLGLVTAVAAVLVRARARIVFVAESLRRQFAASIRSARLRAQTEAASTVAPMGIDIARFERAAADPAVARWRARPAGARSVLVLGRLVPIKGVDIAIEAARAWRASAPLAIAGEGPEEGRLRRRASALPPGRVAWLGALRGEERDRALARAGALALPSRVLPGGRTEGLPVAALEAMAAGVPVIAADVGGLSGLPEAVAIKIPPDDPSALASAVDRLAADEAERGRRIAAGRAFARARDWEAIGAKLCPGI